MMASKKDRRTPDEIRVNRVEISDLLVKGWTQVAIADFLKLPLKTVNYDASVIRREWHRQMMDNITELRVDELVRLSRMDRELWEAWEESKQSKESVTQKARDGTGREVQQTKVSATGDTKYIVALQKNIEIRSKLLGLEAAAKIEHSGSSELNIVISHTAEAMDDDD